MWISDGAGEGDLTHGCESRPATFPCLSQHRFPWQSGLQCWECWEWTKKSSFTMLPYSTAVSNSCISHFCVLATSIDIGLNFQAGIFLLTETALCTRQLLGGKAAVLHTQFCLLEMQKSFKMFYHMPLCLAMWILWNVWQQGVCQLLKAHFCLEVVFGSLWKITA